MAAYLKLFRKGPLTFTKEFVKIPTNDNMALHHTFSIISFHSDYLKPIETFENTSIRKFIGFKDLFLRFLPALINVAKGDISFVGVSFRTANEINELPSDWKKLYLKSKPGIVTEALINFGTSPTTDELYAAESFYSVSYGFKYDMKLLLKYFGKVFNLL